MLNRRQIHPPGAPINATAAGVKAQRGPDLDRRITPSPAIHIFHPERNSNFTSPTRKRGTYSHLSLLAAVGTAERLHIARFHSDIQVRHSQKRRAFSSSQCVSTSFAWLLWSVASEEQQGSQAEAEKTAFGFDRFAHGDSAARLHVMSQFGNASRSIS